MTSPPLDNFHHEVDDHHNFANTFDSSDHLWSLLEDGSIYDQAIEDYETNNSLYQNVVDERENSLAKVSIDEGLMENRLENHKVNSWPVPLEASDNPCIMLQERSILPIDGDKTNNESNSCELLAQEEPTKAVPVLKKVLLENSIKHREDQSLSTILMASQTSCPPLEEGRRLDPSILFGEQNSVLSSFIPAELQQNGVSEHKCLSDRLEASDKSWALLKEGSTSLNSENHDSIGGFESCMLLNEQATSEILANPSIEKDLNGKQLNVKTRERNHKFESLQTQSNIAQLNPERGSISKKQEHNTKEKLRRMKLNTTFLALEALLPADSQRIKKRRSAPVLIDRALEYIPELEKEIEKLNLRKNSLLSTIERKQNASQNPQFEYEDRTVSLHEVIKGELIIQMTCVQKDQDIVFSKVLQNVEAKDISILGASTLQVCNERVCFHLHIQMNGGSLAADSVAALREKVNCHELGQLKCKIIAQGIFTKKMRDVIHQQ